MSLTNNSDIFGAVHENGFNRLIELVRAQRPSVFNYASNLDKLCAPVTPPSNGAPVATVVDPINIPTAERKIPLDYAYQITDLFLDFHPGSITLPRELSPLQEQQFAMRVNACVGIQIPNSDGSIPAELHCACLQVYATGHFKKVNRNGKLYIQPMIDNIEIENITPDNLETLLEKLAEFVINTVVLPGIAFAIEKITFDVGSLLKISLELAPIEPNPSIDENMIKIYLNMGVE